MTKTERQAYAAVAIGALAAMFVWLAVVSHGTTPIVDAPPASAPPPVQTEFAPTEAGDWADVG